MCLDGKLLMVTKKIMLIVGQVENHKNLSTQLL